MCFSFQQKKDYAFSYIVRDHSTGDDFSHRQSQNSKATKGEYRVKLPDGRVQIVSYTADKNGYKADVKYEDSSDEINAKPVVPPVLSSTPKTSVHYVPYPSQPQVSGNPLTQIEIPLYQDQRYQIQPVSQELYQTKQKYVTIYPDLEELQKHTRQYIPHDKVEIYPQGEQKLEDEVPDNIQTLNPIPSTVRPSYDVRTTLVPYTPGHILKDYNDNIVVSTAAPEHYPNAVYVTAPTRHRVVPTTHRYYKKR